MRSERSMARLISVKLLRQVSLCVGFPSAAAVPCKCVIFGVVKIWKTLARDYADLGKSWHARAASGLSMTYNLMTAVEWSTLG